jgi:hypothetical protein
MRTRCTFRTSETNASKSAVEVIVLQNSFWITEDEFFGLWARQSNNRVGTAATSDELTGNFGNALEETSIGDCRLVAISRKNRCMPLSEFCSTIEVKADKGIAPTDF